MVCSCSILNCKKKGGKGDSVKFFSFPRDEALANAWLQHCKPNTKTRSGKVCSIHFTPTDFFKPMRHYIMNEEPKRFRTLKDSAVPTLLLGDNVSEAEENNEVPVKKKVAFTKIDLKSLKRKKSCAVSTMQQEVLVSYMEGNKDLALAVRTYLEKEDKEMADYLWERLASTLNCVSPGAIKDGARWRGYWRERRTFVRKKAALMRERAKARGEEPTILLPRIEQRILDLVGDQPPPSRWAVENIDNISEDQYSVKMPFESSEGQPTVNIVIQEAPIPTVEQPPLYPEVVMMETPGSTERTPGGGTVTLQGLQGLPVTSLDGDKMWFIRVEPAAPRPNLPRLLPRPPAPVEQRSLLTTPTEIDPIPPVPTQLANNTAQPEPNKLDRLEEMIRSNEARMLGSQDALITAVTGLLEVQKKLTDSMKEVKNELQAIRRILQKRPVEEFDHDYN